MSTSLKFSIITVTRNNRSGLIDTLESVRKQSVQNYELVIIDGNSTDGSKEAAGAYGNLVSLFERDEGQGIYPAMNQGVRRASGDWVIFMNSGDIFINERALELFDASGDCDIAFGRARKTDGSPHLDFTGWDNIWKNMPFCHQSIFCRRELLLERPFNPKYNIVADYEFILWAYSNGRTFHEMDYEVSQVEPGGVSETALLRRVWQTYCAVKRYFPQMHVHRFYYKKLKWAWKQQRLTRCKS
ncbi:glycosyltransferase family 2 protein [Haloferula chungangensis]|uniref:Glycosyltransferase family 2 protein n=1 Tax=Haloferula chungangensis TaxID=1048331 RepID=A0ABW2L6R2_9BACT